MGEQPGILIDRIRRPDHDPVPCRPQDVLPGTAQGPVTGTALRSVILRSRHREAHGGVIVQFLFPGAGDHRQQGQGEKYMSVSPFHSFSFYLASRARRTAKPR